MLLPRNFHSLYVLSITLTFGWSMAHSHAVNQDVRITADMNRDGRTDFAMDWNAEVHQSEWTIGRGAIFLNNSDSSQATRTPDNADEVVNGEEDLKDLALVKISRSRRFPHAASLTLTVDNASRERVRVFQKIGEEYVLVDLSARANIDKGRIRAEDLELRIEALGFPNAEWNGRTTLTATMDDGEKQEQDETFLSVAPFILLSNMEEAAEVYVREFPGRNDRFIEQLKSIVSNTGAELRVIPADAPYPANNIWLQDAMEIGYTESPDSTMSVALKGNRNKPIDGFAKDSLLGPGFAWFKQGEFRPEYGAGDGGKSWLDWYGNLEVSPPVDGFPIGRAYYGTAGDAGLNPEIVAMIDAQTFQGPAVGLDVSWLLIKHVDEAVCFVPTGNEAHPHKALVPDVNAMRTLLTRLSEAGHGDVAMGEVFQENVTPASLLGDESLMTHNANTQQRIDAMVTVLKKEFSLRDEDLIRVPALFNAQGASILPNMVNGVVINGHLLVSDPNGPKVNGEDTIQKHFRELLAGLPLEVHFLDDTQYHKWNGNAHCATNVRRKGFDKPWWEMLRPITEEGKTPGGN